MNNHTLRLSHRLTALALAIQPALTGLALMCPATLMAQQSVTANKADSPAAAISSAVKINSSTVEMSYTNGTRLTIDFYGENIFRLFRDDSGGIVRNPAATPAANILTPSARRNVQNVTLEMNESNVIVSTAKVTLRFNRDNGLLQVVNRQSGESVMESAQPVKFKDGATTLALKVRPGEYFYGGGVQNGRFAHRGHEIAIENTNNWVDGGVASPTPYFWSTKGYGLLWHTFKPGRYDFGANDEHTAYITHHDNYLDAFVMVSSQPADLLSDYYQLTGQPVLLPKFGFYQGHLNAYNRDYWKEAENGFMLFEDGKRYNESQKDNGGIRESLNGERNNYPFSARAAIDRYLANDMPLGWFLPNDGYGAGYGQTESLDGNLQNLKEFGDYARSKGVEIGLWTQSDLHPKQGVEPLLQRDIVREVRDAGVRVLKTDVAWVGAGYSFGLNGVSDVGQIMPYYGGDARPFIITLDGWAGTQRYAGVWSGDQTGGNWEYIRFHIPTFIGSGLSGQPNITSDVDGIFGGKNIPVNVREFQWKTFTPMELNMDGWGANAKYPEVLGEPAASINRAYLKLKSELLPYTYTIAHESTNGKPMVRAMLLEYPNDYTYGPQTQYQFMYGPSFLVAPVYKETQCDTDGNDVRNGIYLPEGQWIDYFNGDSYEGGKIINNYEAPLWKLPVFVKSDAIIPMTHPNNTPAHIRKDYRAYEIYASDGCSFTTYDDDGTTQAYLKGAYCQTTISTETGKNRLTVTIDPTIGHFEGFEPNQQTELRINLTQRPQKVTAKRNGKSVPLAETSTLSEFERGDNVYYYNDRPNLNRFSTKGTPFETMVIAKNPQLLVKLKKANVCTEKTEVNVHGFNFSPSDRLRTKKGALSSPKSRIPSENTGPFSIKPDWTKVENADYYEIEFEGMLYSTIRDTEFTFDNLTPETAYTFKLRAVNKDGYSDWTQLSASTQSNPLEWAVKGVKAQSTCANESGTGVGKMFDFDEKSMWHSKWGKGEAIPCELTADLRSVNTLDRLEYLPREDGGNGTLLAGTISTSTDRANWSNPVPFEWSADGTKKIFTFSDTPKARYIKLTLNKAVNNFASGREMYVFKTAGSESVLQGDINRDKYVDENDLTAYMNYTGLRSGDADFDYVSVGDVNKNGSIDAYDISCVAIELDGGVPLSNDKVSGKLVLTPDRNEYAAGDEVRITVSGKDLHAVNAFGFALPYDTQTWQYEGMECKGTKDMLNLTNDRLHTNGEKVLYPTFVNRGYNYLPDEGSETLLVLKFKAKRASRFNLKARNGILVDRNLNTSTFE